MLGVKLCTFEKIPSDGEGRPPTPIPRDTSGFPDA